MHATPRRPRSYLTYSFTGKRYVAGLAPFFSAGTFYLDKTVIGPSGDGTHYTAIVTETGDVTSEAVSGDPSTTTYFNAITLEEMVQKCLTDMTTPYTPDDIALGSFLDTKEKADWVDFRLAPLEVAVGNPDAPSAAIETPIGYVQYEFEYRVVVSWLDMTVVPYGALAPCKIDYNVIWGYFNGGDAYTTSEKGVFFGASVVCEGDGTSPRIPIVPTSGITLSDTTVDNNGAPIGDPPGVGYTWFGLAQVKVTVPY